MSILLEACCTSVEQIVAAHAKGAGRIELCVDLSCGGVTPSEELLRSAVSAAEAQPAIPVNVLVRPRGGNFVFSATEIARMTEDIRMCREKGAAGVVIGALTPDGDVDMAAMQALMFAAKGSGFSERPLSVTFHRAFDEARDPFAALEDIISLGCDRLLTSGQAVSAYEGRELIARLVTRAAGRIIIMPGAGITRANLDEIRRDTGAVEFHGTKVCD